MPVSGVSNGTLTGQEPCGVHDDEFEAALVDPRHVAAEDVGGRRARDPRGELDDVGLVLVGQVLGDVAAMRDDPIGLGGGVLRGSIEAKIWSWVPVIRMRCTTTRTSETGALPQTGPWQSQRRSSSSRARASSWDFTTGWRQPDSITVPSGGATGAARRPARTRAAAGSVSASTTSTGQPDWSM